MGNERSKQMVGLVERARAGDERALDELVRPNRGLVVMATRKLRGCGVDQEDLEQEGCVGLLRALRRFDPALGPWGPYALLWIRAEMFGAIRSQGDVVRLPAYLHAVRRAVRDAEEVLGRSVSDAELAELASVEEEHVGRVRSRARVVASLDAPVGDGDSDLADFVAEAPDARVDQRLLARQVLKAAGLTDLQARFANLRWTELLGRNEAALETGLNPGSARVVEWEVKARVEQAALCLGLASPDPEACSYMARLLCLRVVKGERVLRIAHRLGVHPSRARGELELLERQLPGLRPSVPRAGRARRCRPARAGGLTFRRPPERLIRAPPVRGSPHVDVRRDR